MLSTMQVQLLNSSFHYLENISGPTNAKPGRTISSIISFYDTLLLFFYLTSKESSDRIFYSCKHRLKEPEGKFGIAPK